MGIKGQVTQTFNFTGSSQSFTVPNCVTTITVSLSGGKGGEGLNMSTGSGASGGKVTGVISVSPGQVFEVHVGGQGGNAIIGSGGNGGYNGGGYGSYLGSSYAGGGGGGASDIRISPYTLADRIIVAGGGGGGGMHSSTSFFGEDRGGMGGGTTGENGYIGFSNSNGAGGFGGTSSAGGQGGFNSNFCTTYSGSLGLGGGANSCSNGGGGGGGGYYGGGGGVFAGGGGGSSYASLGFSNIVHTQGANPGFGNVIIAYAPITPTINVVASSTNVCAGSSVSFTASGGINYTWTSIPPTNTITGQDTISSTFQIPGAYAFYAKGDDIFGCVSSKPIVIIVNLRPAVNASVTKNLICAGESTTLNVTGASVFQWDANAGNVAASTTIVNPTITTIYNVTGTLNSTGCSSTASVIVNVYRPLISVSGSTNVCFGHATILTASVVNPPQFAYTWEGPGITNNYSGVAVVSPTLPTIYTISVISTTAGNLTCPGTKTVLVGILSNPTINIVPSKAIVCKGERFKLIASGAASYTWNNNFTGDTITAIHNYLGSGVYTVMGTDINGCKDDTVFLVKIHECVGLRKIESDQERINVYPNPSDGEFIIASEVNLKLKLMNELGEVIREFELTSSNEYKAQVTDLAEGIYFIRASDNETKVRQKIMVK